jgi:hypothetical protein
MINFFTSIISSSVTLDISLILPPYSPHFILQ